MKRRELLRNAGLAALATGLSGCARPATDAVGAGTGNGPAPRLQWKMVTSWPANFPGLGTGAAWLADQITQSTGGRITVKVFGAGEMASAFEVFDLVSAGTAQLGHSASYYWAGKAKAAPFFSAVPFGLNAQEMNGWLYSGGGLELWRELYAPFGLVPFPAGNSGVQMAGWFRKKIESVADLKGLKMRIPGLGGEVMSRVGATPVNIPGGEIFTSLQSGAIDAAEWVGPYNDLAFGLYRVAKYCYYPGWHEPGSTLECMVNKQAFEALPADLQQIVDNCCAALNVRMLSEFTARNQQALEDLRNEHHVEFLPLPAEVLAALKTAAEQVLREVADGDAMAGKVYASMRRFQEQAKAWHAISEEAFYAARR
jgi:TRAP-type mannitol/chloroaromatic compound transport system substrate-binding protein